MKKQTYLSGLERKVPAVNKFRTVPTRHTMGLVILSRKSMTCRDDDGSSVIVLLVSLSTPGRATSQDSVEEKFVFAIVTFQTMPVLERNHIFLNADTGTISACMRAHVVKYTASGTNNVRETCMKF